LDGSDHERGGGGQRASSTSLALGQGEVKGGGKWGGWGGDKARACRIRLLGLHDVCVCGVCVCASTHVHLPLFLSISLSRCISLPPSLPPSRGKTKNQINKKRVKQTNRGTEGGAAQRDTKKNN
jgi:hypothetical protein